MPFPTGNYDAEALQNRVSDSYFFNKDVSARTIPPIALNNEPVSVPNAAGTALVEVFRVDANNRVVLAPGSVAAPTALSVNGAINPRVSANYVVTKAGVLADTLAAPTSGTDDGVTITITSNTANAHTLTSTGLLQTGSASVNLATFAAFAGAGLTLRAYAGKWLVLSQIGITFT